MSLFKESGNDRFKRESQEMWNKISSEKTTKETPFSREKTTTTSSASEQKSSYEERTGSNRSGLLTQSSRLVNGGPGLVEQSQEMNGREGSQVGKIQRANLSNSQNQENIEEPIVAEVALPRSNTGSPSKSSAPNSTKMASNPSRVASAPSKPQPVDIFPRRRTSKFVKSKPAIWETEDASKPLFAIEKKARNKQSNAQTKQANVKCTKK